MTGLIITLSGLPFFAWFKKKKIRGIPGMASL
jgi:hypothetical protein